MPRARKLAPIQLPATQQVAPARTGGPNVASGRGSTRRRGGQPMGERLGELGTGAGMVGGPMIGQGAAVPAGIPKLPPLAGPAAPAAGPPPPAGPPALSAEQTADPFLARPGDSASTITGAGDLWAAWSRTSAGFDAQRNSTLHQLGVTDTGVVDPATGRRFAVDIANNPFSDAAQIQLQFLERRRGEQTNMGGAGLLFDGAYGAQMQATNQDEGRSFDELLNRATGTIGGIEGDRSTAYQDALGRVTGLRSGDADRRALDIPTVGAASGKPASKPAAKPAAPKPAAARPQTVAEKGKAMIGAGAKRIARKGRR